MSFLDRFKSQPKYRNPDPAIRLAGVSELPDDAESWGVIAELAASDEDIRVRRAAIARLAVPGYLSRLARTERDEGLRRDLAERLVAIAVGANASETDATTALEGLSDAKQLGTVAKSSPHESVRTAALGRIQDAKTLGSVARHAADARIALEAASRVEDSAELLAVALKTDHKEAGLAALDRLVAASPEGQGRRDLLANLESRAKNKAVTKRARALIQEQDEADAARKADEEDWQRRITLVAARVDAVATITASADASSQVDAAEADWQGVEARADAAMTERVRARIAEARAAIDARRQAEAARIEEEARAEARRTELAAICERVEALRGDDTPDELARARAEWEGMPGASSQEREDTQLRARFDEACRRATERHENRQVLEQTHARLVQLSLDAERLAAATPVATPAPAPAPVEATVDTEPAASSDAAEPHASLDEAAPQAEAIAVQDADADAAPAVAEAASIESIESPAAAEPDAAAVSAQTPQASEQAGTDRAATEKAHDEAWRALSSEWRSLIDKADGLDPEVVARFAAAEARFRLRADEKRAAVDRVQKQHAQRLEQLIERATARAAAEDLTLREADRAVRDLKSAIDAPPSLPSRDQHAILERLKTALGVMAPRLHDLREMDEWKRFANAAVQEELIAQAEGLRAKYNIGSTDPEKPEDIEKAARDLHDIQERWKQVAEAPRAQAQALWHRYRQAADPIQAKAREFFSHRAEERGANLQRKMALVERAEALSQSTDWIKTADELKKLQAEWQQVGPIPRHDAKTAWKRFRDACDAFFTRRNADLSERKETWSANLAKKDALCVRAEELAGSREWERAAAEIRRLQAEWKTIGPVRRTKSEAIWNRFRAACDAFFERYKRRDEIELESKQADREGLVAELEALAPAPAAADAATPSGEDTPRAELPPDLLDKVRALRTRWNQTTPVVRQGADPLSARFVDALERLMAGNPEAFRGSELDVEASRQKMEKLCIKVEGFLSEAAAQQPSSGPQALADMLREALASNTIGGRAGEENKWRTMAEDVRQAQAAWSRLGPVPGESGRQLSERFHRACSRFFEQFRRKVPPQQHAPRGKPVGAR